MASGAVRVCVGSVPDSSSRGEAMELGWRVINMSTAPLTELQDGSSLTEEPFHKAQARRTLDLLQASCAQHHPNPPLAPSHLPAGELWVKDGWTQPQQAASWGINPSAPCPGSPHPNRILLSTSRELEAFTGGLGGEDGVRRQGEEPRAPGAVQQLWWGYFIKKEKLGFGH